MTKVLHINAGLENGGGLTHIVALLSNWDHHDVSLLVFAEGPVAAAARAAGVDTHVLHFTSRYNLGILKALADFINAGQYDIVHAHGARAVLFLRLIRRRIHCLKVATVHSDPTLDFMGRGLIGEAFTKLYISSLRLMDHLYPVSTPFYDRLRAFNIPADKLTLILNGITFSPQAPVKEPHQTFNMIYVARLHPVKDHALLLNALAQAKLPQARLLLVGDGPEKAKLQQQVADLKLTATVTFTGFQTPTQIQTLYPRMDLALLTSISESFPLVLLEAANAAVPVLSSRVGDVTKLVAHPDLGFLFQSGDQADLVRQLRAAYHDWELGTLAAKGDALRTYAAAHFSLQQLQDTIWDSYAVLLRKELNHG
ncbi:glycosyltransferase family 4 protein [Schleiferilactobacillus harbinensis]|jgi:glycosyltransferase involved in cell wall biosynthesis|nr:glycosyltransferase family 4 protein [Schleiferilactobacillus harbinensis]GEK06171.1 glycosyl transferase [Schleiferilactobacillus harbinensis]